MTEFLASPTVHALAILAGGAAVIALMLLYLRGIGSGEHEPEWTIDNTPADMSGPHGNGL